MDEPVISKAPPAPPHIAHNEATLGAEHATRMTASDEPMPAGDDPLSRMVYADQLAGEWIRKHPGGALMALGAIYHIGPALLAGMASEAAPGAAAAEGGMSAIRGYVGKKLAQHEIREAVGEKAAQSTAGPEFWKDIGVSAGRKGSSDLLRKGAAKGALKQRYELKDIFETIADLYRMGVGR